MGFTCREFGQEGFLVAFFHPDRVAQPGEVAMHVGNQRVFRAFDVLENHGLEMTFFFQSVQNARYPVFRIDFLGNTDDLFRVFLVEILDEPAKIRSVGLVGYPIHDAVPLTCLFYVSFGGSIGPPASIQALMPPSRCATGVRPMSCAVLAASADRHAPAQ
jgi:hypothetical protein